jgi:hypothetical protein
MNSAQQPNNQTTHTSTHTAQNPVHIVTGGISSAGGKENAPIPSSEVAQEIMTEVEIPKEVQEAGVEKISGTIELPPDIKKLGVTAINSPQTASGSPSFPAVSLPISDDTVVKGVHAGVTNALAWLAIWCLKKLKKAHILLKEVHGKIVRVQG